MRFANPALDDILFVPENGDLYLLTRPLTRIEMLDALMRCQSGDATCLFTLNLFEAHTEATIQFLQHR